MLIKLLPLLPITDNPLVHISHTQTPIPFQYLSQNIATTNVWAKFPSSKHQPTNNKPSKSSILQRVSISARKSMCFLQINSSTYFAQKTRPNCLRLVPSSLLLHGVPLLPTFLHRWMPRFSPRLPTMPKFKKCYSSQFLLICIYR